MSELASQLPLDAIIHGDCLQVMPTFPTASVDMILCDLPYGTTACAWDTVLPFDVLWREYERIIKPTGAIVLTASQPFTSALVMSNPSLFRYALVWDKQTPTGFLDSKRRPLKYHEDVLVFYKKQPTYNPQMWEGPPTHGRKAGSRKGDGAEVYNGRFKEVDADTSGIKYPRSIIEARKHTSSENLHPTQKPVGLFEYLIRTYSNPRDVVLDNCAGVSTTAVAAIRTGRRFVCIEQEEKYVRIGWRRVATTTPSLLDAS